MCVMGPHSYLILRLNTYRSYGYYTQLMQAEALATAYRTWRRNWRGKGREYTSGALVWQVITRGDMHHAWDVRADIMV
jgi:hypothetical protein